MPPSRSSRLLRVLVAVGGWFSVLMTAASVQQYYYFSGDTPDERRMRSLQVRTPSVPQYACATFLCRICMYTSMYVDATIYATG